MARVLRLRRHTARRRHRRQVRMRLRQPCPALLAQAVLRLRRPVLACRRLRLRVLVGRRDLRPEQPRPFRPQRRRPRLASVRRVFRRRLDLPVKRVAQVCPRRLQRASVGRRARPRRLQVPVDRRRRLLRALDPR